ncbi:AraC-type DNA-binding protein [Chryseobacterium soldanellicola]|uniref:AraC-type DNA-binding protein n=1 Tax=Chryseobacterium soldanellicola TaxID=311333 RepID=A0A1H1BA61_9FLAO|nr:AraC family transcriptional regulator [Chryseobacterium soldanellicola]SDQ48770.1 AraC-type DNA-binding protein [Chryseobacterium soldanellicola]
MKEQTKKGLLFQSEDFQIVMHEDSDPEKFLKSVFIEEKSSFTLLCMLSQDIHLEIQNRKTHFLFKRNQYILHYSPEETQTELWTENQEILKYIRIQISYQYIFNLINPESSNESAEIFEKMIKNYFIFLHQETPPHLTVEMHLILREILSYSKKGMLQKLFVEAKIIKLLILIFEQFNEKNISEKTPKIAFIIKKFVDENYHKNIKVEEIGKLIGINQNKIRKEFKSQYHITVTDYISELRMLKAKKLIIDKEIMIKEIAFECGYEYVQNFTRAFRKKFGLSPEKLRNG